VSSFRLRERSAGFRNHPFRATQLISESRALPDDDRLELLATPLEDADLLAQVPHHADRSFELSERSVELVLGSLRLRAAPDSRRRERSGMRKPSEEWTY